MRKLPSATVLGVATVVVLVLAATGGAVTATEHLVSPGTAGVTKFPQSKQNESTVAVNPTNAAMAVAGSNDEIQEPLCTPATGGPSSCPFDPFTNSTGVYITTNGGVSSSQQILNWSSAGLVSDGDPAMAWGPKPSGGGFSFASGARLYAASLAGSAAFGPNKEQIALSYSDDNGATWTGPVVISSRDNPVTFNDKVAITTDVNPSSPFFGNVYVSWTLFKGNGNFGESNTFSPEPIALATSTNGGQSFSKLVTLSQAANAGAVGGRQGSSPEVAPNGDVYVFWSGSTHHQSAILGARSTNGGRTFAKPFVVSLSNDNPDPLPGASFRDNSWPNADIGGNGKLYVVWTDYTAGHGVVKLATSTNDGADWTVSTAADVSGRSAFYPAVAVNGSSVFVGFNALDDVPAGTTPGAGVVSYDAYYVLDTGSGFGAPVKISAASSDPDASSTNSLGAQFIGDYNNADVGSNGTFWFTWTDTRDGDTCAAIDAYRAGTGAKPNIYDSCTTDFGNSDIYVATIAP